MATFVKELKSLGRQISPQKGMKHPTCNISSQLSFFTQTSPRTLWRSPFLPHQPQLYPDCRSFPWHQWAGIHSARRASAPRSPMLLPGSNSRSKLPLLLRLAARAWPLGGVGGTLRIDSSPHLPKHRTHIRGNLHCGSCQTNNKWTESPCGTNDPFKNHQRQFAKYGLECPLRDRWKVFGSMNDLYKRDYICCCSIHCGGTASDQTTPGQCPTIL